jgi:hypothetical protein
VSVQGSSFGINVFVARLSHAISQSAVEHGGWHDTCGGILGLTKMDWNNNTLYKKLPVTLVYSKAFADIIQQNLNMVDEVYDFRKFM